MTKLTCYQCEHLYDFGLDGPQCSKGHDNEIDYKYYKCKCSQFKEKHPEYRVQYWIWKGGTHNVYYFHNYDEARCHYMKWIMTQVLETKHVEKVCFETWSYKDEKYKTIYESIQYHPE